MLTACLLLGMVIATHGLIKKTQKTPQKDIQRAEAIMKTYYQQKD